MPNGPTLPPQAYTREILTAAFNWLQTQPESVRKIATTPDALVGLFMRAQRYGNSSLEADAPVSSQNFMSDLKSLAEGLKQFEDPKDQRRYAAQAAAAAAAAAAGIPAPTAPQQQVQNQAHAQHVMHQQMPSPHPGMNGANYGNNMASGQTANFQGLTTHTRQQSMTGFVVNTQGAGSPMGAPLGMMNQESLPAGINENSLRMIQEVKTYFNLSSDAEAINMMVALAYKNLKNLLA
jgi:hypothetical protein